MRFVIASTESPPPDDRRVEIVERKGLGHPDSICDALAEEFSIALSRFYLQHTGRIQHHNVDKALLAAGRARPRFGGGAVDKAMQIFLAGRATLAIDGVETPIDELAEQTTRLWLKHNLRGLDAEHPAIVSSLVRPGSAELVELFDERAKQRGALANDTSCGVGYAPLSEVERVVLAVEQYLNSDAARAAQPALGEDIKVMAVRHDESVELTIACAMIDGALDDLTDYAKAKEDVAELASQAARQITALPLSIEVNAADDLSAGRVYLTVTGTSAEAGDDGQAGRGNRANGLITPGRPMTIESVAGKNPVTHVGKLYNIAASITAERLVAGIAGVRGAECRMVSQIGQPVAEPQWVEVGLVGVEPNQDAELRRDVERVVRETLGDLARFAEELVRGDLRLNQWPLRR